MMPSDDSRLAVEEREENRVQSRDEPDKGRPRVSRAAIREPLSFKSGGKPAIFLRMPSPKGVTPEELEQQSAQLQTLIEDAQALQQEISEHLRRLRLTGQSNAQPIGERRKRRASPGLPESSR
jgi:hypothetical protein